MKYYSVTLFSVVAGLLFLQMMEIGTTFAQLGRTPRDHGCCIKMAKLQLLEKASKKVAARNNLKKELE